MTRRNIIITISILALGIIFGGAYWYFSKGPGASTPGGLFPGESATSTRPIGAGTPTGSTTETPVFTPGSGASLPRLYELHNVPVAGAGFIETKDKKGVPTSIAARYIERGLGYIFETNLSSYAETRIVNETRSGIEEALWGNGGKSVVIRSINDKTGGAIVTHILNISAPSVSFTQSTSTEPASNFLTTEEVFLPDYIPFMATSEDGADKLFYLESGTSATIGSTATFKDATVSTVFSSSFTEWLPQFPNQKLITLTTKPSAEVPGHLFFVDPKTKSVTKILGGINGLTTLTSHDGKFVLYSETRNGRPDLSVYDVAKDISHPLYLQTLPEKCTWGNKNLAVVYCAVPQGLVSATYPDQWYQGLISFSDAVWEINIAALSTKKIMSPSDFAAPVLDVINPVLSSNDAYLLFMNKTSSTPWVYRIAEDIPPLVVATPSSLPPATTTSVASAVSPSSPKLPNAGIDPGMKKIK